MAAKIRAFLYKKDPSQVGGGIYEMVACFPAIGVHVPFSYHAHDGDYDLEAVGEPTVCDCSCESYSGTMEDFSKERGIHDYEVIEIVTKAYAFSERIRVPR